MLMLPQRHVKRYLGVVLYTYDKADKEDGVGVVTGLAWTETWWGYIASRGKCYGRNR